MMKIIANRPEVKQAKSNTTKGKKKSERHVQSIIESQNRPEVKQAKSVFMKLVRNTPEARLAASRASSFYFKNYFIVLKME